jgi:ribosomal protein S18 acetylase RimI-like enzyme
MKTKLSVPTVQLPAIHIRWMIDHDLPDVENIDRRAADYAMTGDEIAEWRKQHRSGYGLTAERDVEIVGFALVRLRSGFVELSRLSVHPAWQRRGVATQLLAKIRSKLGIHRRRVLKTTVRETNLAMQLFLRSQGMRATKVHRRFFTDTYEDAFEFELTVPDKAQCGS